MLGQCWWDLPKQDCKQPHVAANFRLTNLTSYLQRPRVGVGAPRCLMWHQNAAESYIQASVLQSCLTDFGDLVI